MCRVYVCVRVYARARARVYVRVLRMPIRSVLHTVCQRKVTLYH